MAVPSIAGAFPYLLPTNHLTGMLTFDLRNTGTVDG
jgi:hypothetical protein